MARRSNTYSPEQEQFLTNNAYGMSRQELMSAFNNAFGTNKSVLAIKSWCNNRGLLSGRDGRFTDGHVSWQTGLSMDKYKSHFTTESFKKSVVGLNDHRRHSVGDTVAWRGNLYVVVSTEPNTVWEKRIVIKRRRVYEETYGKIPPQHKIIHLDGNRMNCDIDNLYCVPSKFITTMNKNRWLTNNRDITLAAIKWCELFYTLR